MTTCNVPEEIACDRSLSTDWHCRLFFAFAVIFSAAYIIFAGCEVFSSSPPSISMLLIGAVVTFALIIGCLELAVSSCTHAEAS